MRLEQAKRIVCKCLLPAFLMLSPAMLNAAALEVPLLKAKAQLTAEERSWLAQHPTITVAVWPDYPPISFINDQQTIDGFTADYFKLLEAKLGITFKMVVPNQEQLASDDPAVKGVDIVSLMADTEGRRHYWQFITPNLLEFPLHLIARNDNDKKVSLKALSGEKLSVVHSYAERGFLEKNYPSIELDLVNDTCEGLRHVAFGESEALIADLPVASWCLRNQGLINLTPVEQTEFVYHMTVAVRNDRPQLVSIIQKGMQAISDQERQVLFNRWLNQEVFVPSWISKNEAWLTGLVALLLLGGLLKVYAWDNHLQSQILRKIHDVSTAGGYHTQGVSNLRARQLPVIVGLIMFVLLLLGVLIGSSQWVHTQDRILLSVLVVTLMLAMLFGGYKMGSIGRNQDNQALFEDLVTQIKITHSTEQALFEQAQRLAKQQRAISDLTEFQLRPNNSVDEIFQKITALSAVTLDVARASIWLFDTHHQKINCVDVFDSATAQHSSGASLDVRHYKHYFKTLESQRVISANNALVHPATLELKHYLEQHGVRAMLDATLWVNGKVVGVLCHEHAAERAWSLDEQNFASSMADSVCIALESGKRLDLETNLAYQKENLESLVSAQVAAIESNAKLFRFLVDKAPVSILYMNIAGEILEMNVEAERIGGYPRSQVIGNTYQRLFVPRSFRLQHEKYTRDIIAGKKIQGQEVMIKRADGSITELAVSGSMELDADGHPVIITIGQDITQQKALEASLIKAREAAESADRIKSMFVASMSHELRTPLNSIIGFLGIVLQGLSGDINPKQKEQLGRAYQSAKHLLSLISDVIDISKIEAGYLETYVDKVDIANLLDDVRHAVDYLVIERKLSLYIDCPAGTQITTDRKRLYQVVLNVVSNALKYTEQGSVHVRVRESSGMLHVAVEDTGIGISEHDLTKLFKPFERIDSRLRIKTLGTGLGLYLTRKILATLLEGEITVTSQLEVGSVFTIRVPIVPLQNQGQQSVKSEEEST